MYKCCICGEHLCWVYISYTHLSGNCGQKELAKRNWLKLASADKFIIMRQRQEIEGDSRWSVATRKTMDDQSQREPTTTPAERRHDTNNPIQFIQSSIILRLQSCKAVDVSSDAGAERWATTSPPPTDYPRNVLPAHSAPPDELSPCRGCKGECCQLLQLFWLKIDSTTLTLAVECRRLRNCRL